MPSGNMVPQPSDTRVVVALLQHPSPTEEAFDLHSFLVNELDNAGIHASVVEQDAARTRLERRAHRLLEALELVLSDATPGRVADHGVQRVKDYRISSATMEAVRLAVKGGELVLEAAGQHRPGAVISTLFLPSAPPWTIRDGGVYAGEARILFAPEDPLTQPDERRDNLHLAGHAQALREAVEAELCLVEQLREWARLLARRRTPLQSIIAGLREVANDVEDRRQRLLHAATHPAT